MKHLESYSSKNRRKVYWIVPFDERFEDALVRTYIQYIERENEIQRIGLINDALSIAKDARIQYKKNDFAILSMEFEYLNNKLIVTPLFKIWEFKDKTALENAEYIFIGYINTDEEEVDFKISAKKYNL